MAVAPAFGPGPGRGAPTSPGRGPGAPAPPGRGRGPAEGRSGGGALGTVLVENPFTEFDALMAKDLIPFVDSTFRTIPDRDHRAIAGLSMGGAQALRIGVNHLDLFSYIGLFSPAIGQLDVSKHYDGKLADAAALNKNLRLLWIGIGTEDFLHDSVKYCHEVLEKAGVKHVWLESGGSHTWTVWRKYLPEFAGRLF
jgi:enterochelin esterase-like enzyme